MIQENGKTVEEIVGVPRDALRHVVRVRTSDDRVWMLHSVACKDVWGDDLTQCPFSLAVDQGLNHAHWEPYLDIPVYVTLAEGSVHPSRPVYLGGADAAPAEATQSE